MNQDQLALLTDEELRAEAKKGKTAKFYDAAIIGLLIGIAIYSTVKNGFGLFTLLPLFFLPIAAKNKAKNSALKKLLR